MNDIELTIVPRKRQALGAGKTSGKWKALRGLAWCEWYIHSKLLLWFFAGWLAGVWVLPLYASPTWILLFGGVYALLAGPIFGGSNTLDGCEEFTLALPPTRGERYLARLIVGGSVLLLLTAMDLLALGLDLPQILARLYVNAGLIRPRPIFNTGLLYSLVLTLPLMIFALSFVLSAVTHSRRLIMTASFWATLVSLGILRLGFWYEDLVWSKINGYFTCPMLVLLAVAALWAGGRAYACKEIGRQSARVTLPARWWLWSGLFFLGLLLGLILAASLAHHWSRLFPG
jgi:hypothetical protein